MAAPENNQFWKARSKHGRNKIFENCEQMQESACEYFEWVDEHPILEEKAFHSDGNITKTDLNKMRPYTLAGLYIFLGIGRQTWADYRKNDDFSAVIEWVEHVIYEQKFAGAAAGLLNANIIARDLGLKDHSEHDLKSSDGTMTPKNFNDFYSANKTGA